MTMLGKLLVLCNFALSLLLALWSFTLYANRTDWSDTPGKEDRPPGEFARSSEELKKAWAAVRPAEASYRAASNALASSEAHRAANFLWFQQYKQHALVTATADNPVSTVTYVEKEDPRLGQKKEQVAIDPKTGYPKMIAAQDAAGKPLLSLAAYVSEDETISRDLLAVLQKHQDLVEKDTRLTFLLVGDPGRGKKGLQQRLEDERAKRDTLVVEQGIVKPLLINTVVESELILNRRAQLLDRIATLKKIGVATAP